MRNRRSNITDSVREELEFNKVLDLLENFALSSENKNRIRSLSILHNPKVLNHHLDCLEEYISIHSDTNFPKFDYVEDRQNLAMYSHMLESEKEKKEEISCHTPLLRHVRCQEQLNIIMLLSERTDCVFSINQEIDRKPICIVSSNIRKQCIRTFFFCTHRYDYKFSSGW